MKDTVNKPIACDAGYITKMFRNVLIRMWWSCGAKACNPLQKDINPSMPYPSPATSGGIYAIRKARVVTTVTTLDLCFGVSCHV